MHNRVRHKFIVVAFVATVAVFAGLQTHAIASDYYKKSDRDQILQQREAEKTLSLEEIMEKVKPRIKGELIETEFDFEDGIPVYEFKYITKSGVVMELYVDARNGKVIKEKID